MVVFNHFKVWDFPYYVLWGNTFRGGKSMQYPPNWITFLRTTTPTFSQPINIQNTHQLYASDSEWNYIKSTISLQNFELFWNHPKNRRWRRCCTTGTCCMSQSYSTHCNSRGYDLISLAAVLWHHTAAVRCRTAAVRCHTAALRCHTAAMRLWDCRIVLLHKLCDCCTAVRETESFRHKRRASCANPQHKIIHNPGYVHFRTVLIL